MIKDRYLPPGRATHCTPASTGSFGRPSPFLASTGITCGCQQLHRLPFIKRPSSRFAGRYAAQISPLASRALLRTRTYFA